MDAVNTLLGSGIGTATMLVAVVGAAAGLLVFGLSLLVADARNPVRRRLVTQAEPNQSNRAKHRMDFTRFVDPLAKYVLPKRDDERNSTRLRLVQAGFRSDTAVRHFYGIKAVLAVALPLIVMIAARWAPQLSTNMIFVVIAGAAFVGVRLPDLVLSRLRSKRIKRLRNGFPDALDLLVVCVESGLGLAAAIERVAREMEISHEDLAHELALVNAEIRAGVERPVALRNLARRTGVDDINGLVGLLIQTIRFGTSVADALRVYSEEFRDKRMQKAEEQAAKIGTKMIFPLVVCFFPSFFIVAIGPAVLRIVEAFQNM